MTNEEAAHTTLVPRARTLALAEQVATWRKELTQSPDSWVWVIIDILGRDTPSELVQTREGPNRLLLKYVDGAYAIATRAMLSLLGVASDLEVLQTDVNTESVDCLVKLTFKYQGSTISSTQWGECHRRAGMALGDVKKGAVTDGLKKCLSEFGWAWDVYNAEPIAYVPPSPEELRAQAIETFYSIGSGKGLTRAEVDKYVFDKLQKRVEDLDSKDLTSMKRKLQKEDFSGRAL